MFCFVFYLKALVDIERKSPQVEIGELKTA